MHSRELVALLNASAAQRPMFYSFVSCSALFNGMLLLVYGHSCTRLQGYHLVTLQPYLFQVAYTNAGWVLQVIMGILLQLQALALTLQALCCRLNFDLPGEQVLCWIGLRFCFLSRSSVVKTLPFL